MSDPHPPSEELACLDAVVILDRLNDGTLSSEELVRGLLERGAAIDDPHSETALRSVAAYASNALEIARLRDQERGEGRLRGSLHGVPVMIKDNIEAKGLPGTAGATSLVGRPARDAVLVERLREAGAIVLASTNLSQWANMRSPRSTSGWSATGGLVANPWSLDRTAGGSSSGSGAALAAGLTPLAVGTETDGSIICPASVNGVVGLKPTVGVVPTTHVVPLSSSQDSPGPMARSVADVALLFSVLSGTVRTPAPTSFTLNIATNWYIGHPASDAEIWGMVRSLFVERFHLQYHEEQRMSSVMALVVGKNGPKFRDPVEYSHDEISAPGRNGSIAQSKLLAKISVKALASMMSYLCLSMDRLPVVDETGITGEFDLRIDRVPPWGTLPGPRVPFDDICENVSQLGLELKAKREPLRFVVIDHIERPTGN